MISEVMIEGQVENYVMIINLNELGVWSIGGVTTLLNLARKKYHWFYE